MMTAYLYNFNSKATSAMQNKDYVLIEINKEYEA